MGEGGGVRHEKGVKRGEDHLGHQDYMNDSGGAQDERHQSLPHPCCLNYLPGISVVGFLVSRWSGKR